ncbi:vacuolar cation/proton exchanger 2-like isoform X3 [Castanea sativa]|uniref:vacuolar cation/proton exchanger 2-like isoform X3 n=1 Tax=Castanea sativa TaxID=21020 RepID=UPI003F652969
MISMEERIYLENEGISASRCNRTEVHAFEFETFDLRPNENNASSSIFKRIWISLPRSIYVVLFKSRVNMLLPFGPIAILVHHLSEKQGWVYFLSSVGLVPLPELLGVGVEQLAYYTGPSVGGLLDAMFCNITELIIPIYALKYGMVRVVQHFLLGSTLSKLLLVLGSAFFTRGTLDNRRAQVFTEKTILVNTGMWLMAFMAIMFPTLLHSTNTEAYFGKSELSLSRFNSFIMLVTYMSYLFYQLKFHQKQNPIDELLQGVSHEENTPQMTHLEAIGCLFILTVWVSILSRYLVNAIEGASNSMKVSKAFITVILLPLAENACAINFAIRNMLDKTLGVVVVSSTHILMFVLPLCVLLGWIMGKPMDMNFELFEIAVLFITVVMGAFMMQDGTLNYFKGLILIFCYIIAVSLLAIVYKEYPFSEISL